MKKEQKKIQKTVDIHKILTKLGLEESEIDLYIKLLEINGSTITNLSSETGIPRTNVYRAIKKLQEKTIVSRTNRNGKKILIAEHPKKLEAVLKTKETEVAKHLTDLKDLAQHLPLTISTIADLIPSDIEGSKPLIKYFEGVQGFKTVCERSLTNTTDEILFISNMDKWKKVFTDSYAYEYYVPKRLENKLFAKTLAIRTKQASQIKTEDEEYFREMRFLPENFNFDPTIIISDKEISIMISNKPYSAILIQHEGITRLMKNFFNYFWENSAV